MNNFENLPNLVESILFGAGRPIRLSEIKSLMGSQNIAVDLPSIKVALNSLEERYADSSIEINEVASGFRMQIKKSYGYCLYPLWNDSSRKLSQSLPTNNQLLEVISKILEVLLLALKLSGLCLIENGLKLPAIEMFPEGQPYMKQLKLF